MACLGRNGVEVINDVGSGDSLEPVGEKTNVVNAPVGGLPVFLIITVKVCLSPVCDRRVAGRKTSASLSRPKRSAVWVSPSSLAWWSPS